MARQKKAAPPVELGKCVSIGDGFVSRAGNQSWIAVTGNLKSEEDRYATVFFTDAASARTIAAALNTWASQVEEMKQKDSKNAPVA